MKSESKPKLAIFDTFKTRSNDLTGEAKRQRAIISILGNSANPAERTRTGISQKIAKKQEISWKNIYSGIFRDLDEILLPMEIAEEDGRLPLKRGPKALQEKGIPYYHLTKKGILVGLAINGIETMGPQLKEFFSRSDSIEKEFEKLNNDRGLTIQKINQFETELLNLKTHLTMIDGAIQTCTYFLTGKEEINNETAIKS